MREGWQRNSLDGKTSEPLNSNISMLYRRKNAAEKSKIGSSLSVLSFKNIHNLFLEEYLYLYIA